MIPLNFHHLVRKLAVLIILLFSVGTASAYNTIFINYNNTNWVIGSSVNLTGHYFNISNFTLLPNGSITITRWTNYTNGEGLTINATNINISGNISGDGMGFPGSAGGGGASGGCGAGSSCTNGLGSGGTNWDSSQATTGGAPSFLSGGTGGGSSNSYYGLSSSQSPFTTSGASGQSGGGGGGTCTGNLQTASSGNTAPIHTENSIAANATLGGGGSGGGAGGGGGASSTYNQGGGGGGGGGAGGDGGSYINLVASNKIIISPGVIISMRPGQNSCSARNGAAGGGGDLPNGGSGGAGGSTNNLGNCASGTGGNRGGGNTKSCGGGQGGNGGSGAAGEIVLAAPTLDLGNNSQFNVTDTVGGGSIKELYRIGIVNPNTVAGYSSLLVSSYDNTPNITSLTIKPSPATAAVNLSCNWTITDIDGDAYNVTINWTVNNIQKTSHNITLTTGNYSNGDNVTCQATASDGMLSSAWKNSSILFLNDNTAPNITSIFTDFVNVTTADTVNFQINATDSDSPLTSTSCQFTLVKSDYNGGNGVGNPYNITTNTINGNTLSFSQTMASLGTGTLSWTKAFCTDGSQNTIANNSVNINISITQYIAPPPSSGGGGGGGGGSSVIPASSFQIIRPTNGFIYPNCPAGQAGSNQEYEILNNGATQEYFTTKFNNINCQTNQTTFSVSGHQTYIGVISQCPCPTNSEGTTSGELEITTGTDSQTIPILLYNNFLTRILNDPGYLTEVLIVLFIIGILAITSIVIYIRIKNG